LVTPKKVTTTTEGLSDWISVALPSHCSSSPLYRWIMGISKPVALPKVTVAQTPVTLDQWDKEILIIVILRWKIIACMLEF
jgi:hypothetical protein